MRKFVWTGSFAHIENGSGRVETRTVEGEFATQFENSDQFALRYTRAYELLVQPFRIAPNVAVPVGGYGFANVFGGFNLLARGFPALTNRALIVKINRLFRF